MSASLLRHCLRANASRMNIQRIQRCIPQLAFTPVIRAFGQDFVRYNTTINNRDSRWKPQIAIQGFHDITKEKTYTLKYIMYSLTYLLTYSSTYLLTYSYLGMY